MARGGASPGTVLGVLGCALVVVGLCLGAGPASVLAATDGPPKFEGSLIPVLEVHATRASVEGAEVNLGGLETNWHIATAASKEGPWTEVASGILTTTTGFPRRPISAVIGHLKPQTEYYVRIVVENALGNATEVSEPFTTLEVGAPEFLEATCSSGGFSQHNLLPLNHEVPHPHMCVKNRVTGADLFAAIDSDGAETGYHFEYATTESGPYKPIAGAEGVVTVAEDFSQTKTVNLTGLTPETTYFIRLVANNEKGTISGVFEEFKTHPAHPEVFTRGFRDLLASSVHLIGEVIPDESETHWRFEYSTSKAGPWNPALGAEGTIPAAEADTEFHTVEGDLSGLGPATVYYVRVFAENGHEPASVSAPVSVETSGPPTAATFATHAIHGEAVRVLGSVEPHGYDAHYRFEYVTQQQFAEGGWAKARSAPELDAGGGGKEEGEAEFRATGENFYTDLVGEDLLGLEAGMNYRYRIVATNAAPGSPVVVGNEQALTVPATPESAGGEACPNEALRTGPSAQLPDCRGYEQVTPADKEGAMDVFRYGGGFEQSLVGEDGDHFWLFAPSVQWGSSPDSTSSSYMFAHQEGGGWQMTSATPQPEAGVDTYEPSLFDPDLTQLAAPVGWSTNSRTLSAGLEFKFGPFGGPYANATAASVPRGDVRENQGWVAASADFSKLILQLEDHTLLGKSTGTVGGPDLYEDSQGQLRQVNVGIGVCGARIAKGEGEQTGRVSSPHAVSADGSRVFFEAVPGTDCSAPSHLYIRVNGMETVDVGAYIFLAADATGSRVLLEKQTGETHEVFLYETRSGTARPLVGLASREGLHQVIVSGDLSTVYFQSKEQLAPEAPPLQSEATTGLAAPENLYRYEVPASGQAPAATPSFIVQDAESGGAGEDFVSPDGRYFYFGSEGLGGVPGGGKLLNSGGITDTDQIYRYDSVEDVVQCMSCASPFDPEPKSNSIFLAGSNRGTLDNSDGVPVATVASANGDYVFFDTAAALVPQDVDGEVEPEGVEVEGGEDSEHQSFFFSTSSDVYEWRKDGVSGCGALQGCIRLISSGKGGYLVKLLGTDPSGENVFFATHESLVPQDVDTAGDVYDARIGGGEVQPPAGPVECEGDACSTPFAAPSDLTPSSATFQGMSDLASEVGPPATTKAKPKPKKPKAKRKKRSKSNGKPGKSSGKSKRGKKASNNRRGR